MGDKNVIFLLTSINNGIKELVKASLPQNEDVESQNTVASLHKGGLDDANIKPQEKITVPNIKAGDLNSASSSLAGLSAGVISIAALKRRQISNFTSVMTELSATLEVFNKSGITKSTVTSTKDIAEVLYNITRIDGKALSSFLKAVGNVDFSDNAVLLAETLVKTSAALNKTNPENIKLFVSSIAALNTLADTSLLKVAVKLGMSNSLDLDKNLVLLAQSMGKSITAFKKIQKTDVEAFVISVNTISTLADISLIKFAHSLSKIEKEKFYDNFEEFSKSMATNAKYFKNIKKTEIQAFVESVKTMSELSNIAPKLAIMSPLIKPAMIALHAIGAGTSSLIKEFGDIDKSDIKKAKESAEALKLVVSGLTSFTLSVIAMAAATAIIGPKNMMIGLGISMLAVTGLSVICVGLGSLISILPGVEKGLASAGKAFDGIHKFIFSAIATIGAAALIGTFINANTVKTIGVGMAAIAATMLIIAATAGTCALISNVIGGLMSKTNDPTDKSKTGSGFKDIVKFVGWSVAFIGLSYIVGLAVSQPNVLKTIGTGMGVIVATMLGLAAVSALAAKISGNIATNNKSLKAIMFFSLWGFGMTVASTAMGKYLDDNNAYKYTAIGFGVMTAVILGFAGVSRLVNSITKDVAKSTGEILTIISFAGLGIGLLWATIELSKKALDIGYDNVVGTFAIMSGMILGVSGMAKLASKMDKKSIAVGGLALGAATGIIMLAGSAMQIVANVANSIGGEGGRKLVLETLGIMGLAVGAFTALMLGVGAMAANPVVAIALAAGAATLTVVSGVVMLVSSAITHVINVQKLLLDFDKQNKQNNVNTEQLGQVLRNTMNVFSYDNLKLGLSWKECKQLTRDYGMLSILTSGLKKSLSVVGELAEFGMKMSEKGMIRPATKDKDGNYVLSGGPGISMHDIAVNIVDTISTFIGIFKQEMPSLENLAKTVITFKAVSVIIDPISKLGGLLDQFGKYGAKGEIYIPPVEGAEEGSEYSHGRTVLLSQVAVNIITAVSTFVHELNKHSEDLVIKNKGRMKRSMKALGEMTDPISGFANMVATFASEGATKLVTDKGTVDLSQVASTIASAISSFVNILFNKNNKKAWRLAGKADDGVDVLSTLLSPVAAFADALSMYNVSQGKLSVANPDGTFRVIDVAKISTLLFDSISTFVGKMNNVPGVNATAGNSIKTVNDFADALIARGTPENISTIEGFNNIVVKTKDTISEFDSVIEKNSKKRADALKSFTNAINDLKNAFAGQDTTITEMRYLFEALNAADTEKVKGVIAEINGVRPGKAGVAAGGNGTTVVKTITQDEMREAVRDAIHDAFNGATIMNDSKITKAAGTTSEQRVSGTNIFILPDIS